MSHLESTPMDSMYRTWVKDKRILRVTGYQSMKPQA